ncbi:MAG: aldehyde dehydrogenase family protein [Phormidesmis sp.]
MAISSFDLTTALKAVRQAANQLDSTDSCSEAVSAALESMGQALTQRKDDILEANTLDLEISRDMAVPDLVVDWLKLTPERVQTAADIFHRLAVVGPPSVAFNDSSDYRTKPLGIVSFIYEAFPDLGAIAAGLTLCTGNALVLKGGSEASRTNQIIASILQSTLKKVGLPEMLIFTIEPTEVSRLDLAQCAEIDLIITHGRPSLVNQVVQQSSRPVIPSRMGNCYLYWSASGSLDQVYRMILESHTGTPDAVNRIEKVLLHESHSENSVSRLWSRLQEKGFEIRADSSIFRWQDSADVQLPRLENTKDGLKVTTAEDWDTAYLRRTVAFRSVKDGAIATDWINAHSSGHADSIVTADYAESRRFIDCCRSASVYVNASPQFVRNAKRAEAIALGLSSHKGQAGGLIGMTVMQERQRIFHPY